jgi:methylated-DNA-protein-cysteine methyltransferase-like protein
MQAVRILSDQQPALVMPIEFAIRHCLAATGRNVAHGMMWHIMSKPARPVRPARHPRASADVDERDRRIAAIIEVVRRIPRGRVTTYGSVAARAGLPRQARLVGKVLAGLPPNSGIPWQRVVAAGGRIAFPDGSPARERQVSRLRAEGVDAARGRVDLARHGWGAPVGDLDQLLWSGE